MVLHRNWCAALALAALGACAPSVPNTPPPTAPGASGPSIDYAVFDPTAAAIPQPNDLSLQPSTIAAQTGAQKELLTLFAANGGWPNDQEVPITIDIRRENVDPATGAITYTAPDLDTATVARAVILVAVDSSTTPPTIGDAGLDTAAIQYVKTSTKGTLVLHHTADPTTGSRRWVAGRKYILGLRGGSQGVLTTAQGTINPMPVTFLLEQKSALTGPEFETIIPGSTPAAKAATAAQLEALRQSYQPAFAAIEAAGAAAGVTRDQLALVQTFTVAPAKTGGQVVTDASAGAVPLPSDLLLDPATNKIVNNPGFGALASGLATLDGFSTTAMILSNTTAPVVAATVKTGVYLYDLSNPAAPVRLKEVAETAPTFAGAAYVAEPFVLTKQADGTTPCTATDPAAGCFSTAIGLQPATLFNASPPLSVPPLKEGTEYAVLVTDGVLVAGATPTPLQRSTLSSILLFDSALVDANGKSQIAGQTDATAGGLEKIRQGVGAAIAALHAEKPELTKANVVLGYTFRTQSISQTALQLAAAPYANAAAFVPVAGSMTVVPEAAYPAPMPAVQEVLSVKIPTLDPIDRTTGALNPTTTAWTPTALNALVVVPQAATGAPLVVFQHGITRNKGDVLAIANTLAAAGFVVAAIDFPLHGDRALCTADAECTCPAGATGCTATCTLFGATALPGDAAPVGLCSGGSVADPAISGRSFVSLNLFRTRDALRQQILDTSALILALAPLGVPSNDLAAELAAKGVTIDPTKVYWVGQSLGGIMGTLATASNPRISRAVLNVPGGTLTDVFANSPSFSTAVGQLLANVPAPLGPITPGSANYLKFIQISKLILDGADPINFAPHMTNADTTWANLLVPPQPSTPQPRQTAKNVFGQYAVCDQTIPNTYNLTLFSTAGLTSGAGPNPYSSYSVTAAGTPGACTATNPHGFLLSPVSGELNVTVAGQTDAVGYLSTLAVPAAVRP